MPAGRQAIPEPLRRDVLVEAGHRCAIPTCRQIPVEIAHIEPWSKVHEHKFDNLIALCPTCHARAEGGGIDRPALRQYKANLSVLNHRYSDLERRVLEAFADRPTDRHVSLPGGLELLLWYLFRDGYLVEWRPPHGGELVEIMGMPMHKVYELTDEGRAFVNRWVEPRDLDD